MSNIKFEWDAKKASSNKKKHGISFDEARTVFFDEHAKLIDDPDHSNDEDRFVLSNIDKRCTMRKEYDFSKARKNPYATQLKKQITIRLDEDSIGYFKSISEQVGIPYHSLINLYLRDCAVHNRKLDLSWK